ncbi:hypothetical protein EDC01DRAFT_644946 [Geopyxis carbonaria]|nr:hypothetical protein EDC01DRAFT_644946 [Geopyxis carbonaria]
MMYPNASTLLRAAVPAIAALSYLDAKYSITNDIWLIYPFAASTIGIKYNARRDTLNLFYYLERWALSKKAEERQHIFLIYEGREWTYEQAYQIVLRHAAWLHERHGVKRGSIVAMDFMNKPAFIWLWFGLWALGATPAFINYNLVGDRLLHCVKAATASLVIVDDEIASVLEDEHTKKGLTENGQRPVVVFDEHTRKAVETWRAIRPPDSDRSCTPPDAGMLIFTSGTTGMPKPAVVAWHKIHNACGFASRWMGLRKDDRFYTSMPLYHSSAAMLGVSQCLWRGCTLVLGHKFSATRTIPEIRDSGATIFQYVGETCRYLLASPPHPDDKKTKLRMAFGNGLRPDIWKPFKERFNIPVVGEFYAATEGHSGSWNFQRGEFAIGAIGRNGIITNALLGYGTKIVRLDFDTEAPWRDPKTGLCTPVNTNEPGEVVWKLDPNDIKSRFHGYFNNDSASNEKVIRDVFSKGDAWFRTGDVQRRDADGLWYFIDRIGDTFRWKSENVSTAEVADVVSLHPEVEECVVFGVALPNHDGRCGCAVIVLKPGVDEVQFMKTFESHVEQLPKYARPLFVRVVKALERTGNNKLVKHNYKTAGVDVTNPNLGRVWWCPKWGTPEGYTEFKEVSWKRMDSGQVKL